MFVKCVPTLFEKGVLMTPLLNSQVFSFDFDYDEWPGTHTNEDTYIRPYNESIFHIRKHYKTVFPEEEFDDFRDEDGQAKEKIDTSRIYKIKYTINLLPQIGCHIEMVTDESGKVTPTYFNQESDLMKIIATSEELEIFNCTSL